MSKHQILFSLGVENGQTGAGQAGRTCLARPNSQARTGTEIISFSVELTTIIDHSRMSNLKRLIYLSSHKSDDHA